MDQNSATSFERMVEDLRQEIADREEALYSDVVLREARNPKNVGRIEDPDLHGLVHGWCGDTMEIFLRVEDETIEEAAFVTDGCGATLACGSMLTQMVTGMQLDKAEWVLPKDLINALQGLPEEHEHCAGLAISTLQNALFTWRVSQMADEEADE